MRNADMIRLARQRMAAGGVTLLPLADAARILDVQSRTAYHWVERGMLARHACPPEGVPRIKTVLVDLGEALRVRDTSLVHPTGSALSYREIEMVRLAASGCTNQEIGARLGSTEPTIANAMKRALDKIGARNRAHGAVIALYLNLIGFQDIDLPEER